MTLKEQADVLRWIARRGPTTDWPQGGAALLVQLIHELDDAYAELRKQWPAMTAVFDREVHERAKKAAE
jgi:hypothetical protein